MILEVKNISKCFAVERGLFKQEAGKVLALDNVSFGVDEFQTLGIVGESGSGKTTLAKILLRLIEPSAGEAIFNPERITDFRKDVQIVFQNPYNSLDPKMRIFDILSEPLLIHKITPKNNFSARTQELLRNVGLDKEALRRLPAEFSGGQRQRICIARALACGPKLIVLDEPISSLDLTVQAEMLELFRELKNRLKLTYLFISHNLTVIKYIADSLIVLENGRIVEQGKCADIFNHPLNAYTRLLLEAAKA